MRKCTETDSIRMFVDRYEKVNKSNMTIKNLIVLNICGHVIL